MRTARAYIAAALALTAGIAVGCLAMSYEQPRTSALSTAHGAPSPKAARSIHLWWQGPTAKSFYQELTVKQSTPGSFFMACGFDQGYFGLQQLVNSRGPDSTDKVVLFSVWDAHDGDDPNAVPESRRVKVIHQDKAVRIGRFGNEGTGAQCFYPYDWQPEQTCGFVIQATVDGEFVRYGAWFQGSRGEPWKHLATFETRRRDAQAAADIRSPYSFVEDFRRDHDSAKQMRIASFGHAWLQQADGSWQPVTEAVFTAEEVGPEQFNAYTKANRFHLATGGDVQQQTPLNSRLRVEPAEWDRRSFDLPEAVAGDGPR